jgi:hypothetical protein
MIASIFNLPCPSFTIILQFYSTACVDNAVSLNKIREIDSVRIWTGFQGQGFQVLE